MLESKNIGIILAVVIVSIVGFSYFLSSGNNTKGEEVAVTAEKTPETEHMNNNIVVFKTNLGDIEIELFEEESPITAGNFKKLAEEGFYDGVRFHRVIKGFMIQSGDPLSKDVEAKEDWGTGGPGYAIEDEAIEGLSNVRGTIAMANSGPNSGGSQFFINLQDNTPLDWDKEPSQSKHPVFGKVVAGMDIVDKIAEVETDGPAQLGGHDRPLEDVVIEKVEIK